MPFAVLHLGDACRRKVEWVVFDLARSDVREAMEGVHSAKAVSEGLGNSGAFDSLLEGTPDIGT